MIPLISFSTQRGPCLPAASKALKKRKVQGQDLSAFEECMNRNCEFRRMPECEPQQRRNAKAQVAAFFSCPGIAIGECPLAWWAAQGCKAFPSLVTAARKALATPGTSAVIERTWSSGRRLLAFNKAQMDGEFAGNILRSHYNVTPLGLWSTGDEDSHGESTDEETSSVPEPVWRL